jgi:hypothetical protein
MAGHVGSQALRRATACRAINRRKWIHTQALIVCCAAFSGCTVCQNFKRTMWHEPAAFSWKHDRRLSVEVYREWAGRAWQQASLDCPQMLSDNDYALGFRDGFVDYVYAGGNGEPPPVPPRPYWNVMLRSPEGKQRADRWFAGYRHGAQSARVGGYRELGTIRTSLVGAAEPFDTSLYTPQLAAPQGADAVGAGLPKESLPEPRSTPNFPGPHAPNRTSTDAGSASGRASGPITSPKSRESGARPSFEPLDETNSTEQPDDLPLPEEELLGDPFQSDGAHHSVPQRRPSIEAAAPDVGDAISRAPLRLAVAKSQTPEPETRGSMIRMLAAPINAAPGTAPKIVVHLTPTPVTENAVQVKEAQASTADVQIASARDEEHRSIDAEASTIRIRTESVDAPRAALPPIPKRKATFLR